MLRKLFCKHTLEPIRDIHGDEIIHRGWNRSIHKCTKCGREILKPHLINNGGEE